MIDNNSYTRTIKNKLKFLSLISKKKKKKEEEEEEEEIFKPQTQGCQARWN